MADELLPEMTDFHIAFRYLLHAVNLQHGTNSFTSSPKEGVLRIFSPWKIRWLQPGLNPWTWVPKASTLPLDHWSRLHGCCRWLSHLFPISYLCCYMYCLCQLCCSRYCLCVNVYCTTATGCQPNCGKQIYHVISCKPVIIKQNLFHKLIVFTIQWQKSNEAVEW